MIKCKVILAENADILQQNINTCIKSIRGNITNTNLVFTSHLYCATIYYSEAQSYETPYGNIKIDNGYIPGEDD